MSVGATHPFNATAYNGSAPMAGVNLSFTSSNTTVGNVTTLYTITGADGNATVTFSAYAAGTTHVNATNGSISGSANVTVNVTSPLPGALAIIGSAPTSPVNDITGAIRTFNITANQTVNVNWYINGTSVQTNTSVTMTSYTNSSAATGTWNVTAIATNANGSAMNIWTWIVSAVPTYGVSLTNVSALSQQANATNATYVLNLTNNGAAVDSYTLTITNLNGASTAGINISSPYPLAAGQTKIFALNVTHTISGTFVVHVTATSQNGTSKTASISTTTIVNRTIVNSIIGTIINTSTFITNATLEIAAPSGNVIVTIPNGTNASMGGVALTSILVDSLAQVNSTFTLGSNERLVGENLSLGPEGAHFSPDIQIQFNYTDAMLTAAGISASELRVKSYNTTTNT
jgi:hypothetical protein